MTNLSKFDDLISKLNILNFSVNNKVKHLLRSLSSIRDPAQQFCQDFDQQIMNFFKHNFHIQDANKKSGNADETFDHQLKSRITISNAGSHISLPCL